MSLSLYQASVPTFDVSLNAFLAILDKAAAHAAARKFDPPIYLTLRLRPDMLPFARQVQTFCDNAKNASVALAGVGAAALRGQRGLARRAQGAHPEDARLHRRRSTPRRSTPAPSARSSFPSAPNKTKMQRRQLSPAFRAAEFLFPSVDRLRHPALRRRRRSASATSSAQSPASRRSEVLSYRKGAFHEHRRIGVGPRMSQAVVHGQTIYLAGQVADKAAGKSVGEQTREILADDRRAARQGGDRQDAAPLGDDLSRRHRRPSPR